MVATVLNPVALFDESDMLGRRLPRFAPAKWILEERNEEREVKTALDANGPDKTGRSIPEAAREAF